MRLLINALGANLGWFASVWGAATSRFWLGPAIIAVLLAIHLYLHRPRKPVWTLVLTALLIGLAVDSLLIYVGAFTPRRDWLSHPLTTVWLLGLWVNYSLTLNVSLKILQRNVLYGLVFGALGGPVAYWAGAKLGAVELHGKAGWALVGIGAAWAVTCPLLSRVARVVYFTFSRSGNA